MLSQMKKISYNLRTSIVLKLLRLISNDIYKKLYNLVLEQGKELYYDVSYLPRPSINIIKRYFPKTLKLIGLEIGVMKGHNSLKLLKHLPIEKLYLIDVWKEYKESDNDFYKNQENYQHCINLFKNNNKVEIIREFSHIALKTFPNNFFDFVYIDGNHSFKYAYRDILLCYQKVKPNGLICGHDILNYPTVLQANIKFAKKYNTHFFIDVPDFYMIKGVDKYT